MNENTTNSVAGAVSRHVAGGAGVGLAVSAQDDLLQLAGLLVTVASLAWSIYEKLRAGRSLPPATPPTP